MKHVALVATFLLSWAAAASAQPGLWGPILHGRRANPKKDPHLVAALQIIDRPGYSHIARDIRDGKIKVYWLDRERMDGFAGLAAFNSIWLANDLKARPAHLTSVLVHEGTHANGFVTRGWLRSEEAAYRNQARFVYETGLPRNTSWFHYPDIERLSDAELRREIERLIPAYRRNRREHVREAFTNAVTIPIAWHQRYQWMRQETNERVAELVWDGTKWTAGRARAGGEKVLDGGRWVIHRVPGLPRWGGSKPQSPPPPSPTPTATPRVASGGLVIVRPGTRPAGWTEGALKKLERASE